MQAATSERTGVQVESQEAQKPFDAARLEVDRAQPELVALKARLAEEEAVSKLLEARLDALAAEMLDEVPDVIAGRQARPTASFSLPRRGFAA